MHSTGLKLEGVSAHQEKPYLFKKEVVFAKQVMVIKSNGVLV